MVLCNLTRQDRDVVEALTGQPYHVDDVTVRCMGYAGPKWTFVDEKDPDYALVVGGFIPQRTGVYASWFFASKQAWKLYREEVTAMARERVGYMLASGAHRVETLSLADKKIACAWYEAIGLTRESTLRKFAADGRDAVLYVAVR